LGNCFFRTEAHRLQGRGIIGFPPSNQVTLGGGRGQHILGGLTPSVAVEEKKTLGGTPNE